MNKSLEAALELLQNNPLADTLIITEAAYKELEMTAGIKNGFVDHGATLIGNPLFWAAYGLKVVISYYMPENVGGIESLGQLYFKKIVDTPLD